MRLARLANQNLKNQQQQKNEQLQQCVGCAGVQFVWDYTSGDIICENCGIVCPDSITQDERAFAFFRAPDGDFGASFTNTHSTERTLKSSSDPIYVRYFHFNEVLATLTLEGPWINHADYREIERMLQAWNIRHPVRGDVQRVCQYLNKFYKVQRFTKKYTEKWIQVVYRYNGNRPPMLRMELIHSLRMDFKALVQRWPEVEKLLTGTRKHANKRVQWPNYLETIYRLLKHRYPHALTGLKSWITRLSQKKRKELKVFFRQIFKLVGW